MRQPGRKYLQVQSLPGSGLLCVSCRRASKKARIAAPGAGVGFLLSLALNDRSYLLPPRGRTFIVLAGQPRGLQQPREPPTRARETGLSRRNVLPAAPECAPLAVGWAPGITRVCLLLIHFACAQAPARRSFYCLEGNTAFGFFPLFSSFLCN